MRGTWNCVGGNETPKRLAILFILIVLTFRWGFPYGPGYTHATITAATSCVPAIDYSDDLSIDRAASASGERDGPPLPAISTPAPLPRSLSIVFEAGRKKRGKKKI